MEEIAVLLRAYGRAQERCSRLLADQAAQILRLRAALVLRDSALALLQDQPAARTGPCSAPRSEGREKAVLCVGGAEASCAMARQLVEVAGGRYLHHDGQDDLGAAALEASLRAADLVICQTGCVSHGAYWRVQDHCRRTGKPCVLLGEEEAQPIRIVRRGGALGS